MMRCCKMFGSILLIVVMLLSIVPSTVFATAESTEISEEFSKILTDGKLVLNYAKPSSKDDSLAQIACESFEDATGIFSLHDEQGEVTLSDDLSKVTIGMWKNMEEVERHTVDVVWNYDADVLQASKELTKSFPEDWASYISLTLSDLEFVNYLVYQKPGFTEDALANFSGELKAALRQTNFYFNVQVYGGGHEPFYTTNGGTAKLMHNGIVYQFLGGINAQADHAIYVPESTADTKDALIAAAQKRVDEYIGKNIVKITDSGKTLSEHYEQVREEIAAMIASVEQEIAGYQQEIDTLQAAIDAELANAPYHNEYFVTTSQEQILQYQNIISGRSSYKDDLVNEYNNAEPQEEYLKNAAGGYIFNVTVAGRDQVYEFVIVKDDDKLAVPTYESVDVNTNVSASTDSSEVPLDTVIKVEKITHGEEHERICGTLEIKDGEIFDIKLHSGSLDDYISQIKNGKFKVRLPIKNEYKDKELVVYYVDANGKITEYAVTIKNGFAFFETDHFSVYTLTVQADSEPTPPNDDKDQPTTPETNDSSNPALWFTALAVAGFFLIATAALGRKKQEN